MFYVSVFRKQYQLKTIGIFFLHTKSSASPEVKVTEALQTETERAIKELFISVATQL